MKYLGQHGGRRPVCVMSSSEALASKLFAYVVAMAGQNKCAQLTSDRVRLLTAESMTKQWGQRFARDPNIVVTECDGK